MFNGLFFKILNFLLSGKIRSESSTMAYKVCIGMAALIVTRETKKALIDDVPFRLQYEFATAIAFLSEAIIGASELVGK